MFSAKADKFKYINSYSNLNANVEVNVGAKRT